MSDSQSSVVQSLIEKVRPLLGELELERQEVLRRKKKAYWWMGIAVVIWMGVFLLVSTGILAVVICLIGCGITIFVIYRVLVGKRVREYKARFKQQVFGRLASLIYPDLRYSPHRGISKSLFKSTGLVKSRIDRYASEDLFHGEIGETEVYFAEVKAEREDRSTDSNGKTNSSWTTVFDGVFFMADFHKEFVTSVTVMPDFAEKHFGWLGKKLQNMGGKVVRLENPEFEKVFVVRGSDQVEARYILTPDMQERLLQLKRSLGARMMIAFQQSTVVVLFDVKQNWFEPNIHVAAHESEPIRKFLLELQTCCGIIEALNLNTRLWTK